MRADTRAYGATLGEPEPGQLETQLDEVEQGSIAEIVALLKQIAAAKVAGTPSERLRQRLIRCLAAARV